MIFIKRDLAENKLRTKTTERIDTSGRNESHRSSAFAKKKQLSFKQRMTNFLKILWRNQKHKT